ncbi:MAG TPA: TatD family hydrolase [Candidatus Nitrosotalea sp.]|nr:TatD family hydrolase [Nitrososphaerota archaeon]HKU33447.1 TatD family hydrolase [Candidatus Nitrosotalea sp.]
MARFFDPHIHMYSRTTDDYVAMAKAGIEVVVQPSFWLGSPRTQVGTFEDYWEHMITFETKRAKDFGIEHFVCISVNPKEATIRPLATDAIEPMKQKYLDRPNVVAIGELGYNLINDLEEEVFLKQMEIAASKDMLMMVHLPHTNKVEAMRRIEKILQNHHYNREKILIDHNTEETIEKTLKLGLWAGLSVYPVTKLSPERATKIIQKHGSDHIMINSAADWGVSNPLSVPLTAQKMKSEGVSSEEIEKATLYNAYDFYKQSPRFTWKP